ncbi:GTP 3',8-cyclase MoaA [Enterococcus sp. AZ109]|uniref:GTP 3',8-cyclase MoaA n=1 Tax=Enterococcus sp. AZ109 TaxID=2774634 RepID=UPI003F28FC2D
MGTLNRNLDLKDRFGRKHDYVRIAITDKCNLRCVYCMPEEGIQFFSDESILSSSEIIRMCRHFAQMGIEKIRLTGGEPLLRSDILTIIEGIAEIPEIKDISLTTNGLALAKQAANLKRAGLNRLNISLDTFDSERYRRITRGGSLRRVLAGIEAAQAEGFSQIKLNVVVMRGQNQQELKDFLSYTFDHQVNVRFIEIMPIGEDDSSRWEENYLGIEQVFDICREHGWDYQEVQLAGNGPSVNYQIEGATGTFGLIHPVSCRFCDSCNRLRVTADGYLKSCLYWEDEINLRQTIGDFVLFEAAIMEALASKPKNHEMALDKLEKQPEKTKRLMSQIGG